MSSRGELFVSEDVHDVVLEKYPEYGDTDFFLQATTPIDAWSDEQLPEAFSVEMIDVDGGDVIARFEVRVKFGIEEYDFGQRCVAVETVNVHRTWDKDRGEEQAAERIVCPSCNTSGKFRVTAVTEYIYDVRTGQAVLENGGPVLFDRGGKGSDDADAVLGPVTCLECWHVFRLGDLPEGFQRQAARIASSGVAG